MFVENLGGWMNSDSRRNALLSRGYFPKELPQTFTTDDFGRNSKEILESWENSKVFGYEKSLKVPRSSNRKRGSYKYKIQSAELEIVSMPKRGY